VVLLFLLVYILNIVIVDCVLAGVLRLITKKKQAAWRYRTLCLFFPSVTSCLLHFPGDHNFVLLFTVVILVVAISLIPYANHHYLFAIYLTFCRCCSCCSGVDSVVALFVTLLLFCVGVVVTALLRVRLLFVAVVVVVHLLNSVWLRFCSVLFVCSCSFICCCVVDLHVDLLRWNVWLFVIVLFVLVVTVTLFVVVVVVCCCFCLLRCSRCLLPFVVVVFCSCRVVYLLPFLCCDICVVVTLRLRCCCILLLIYLYLLFVRCYYLAFRFLGICYCLCCSAFCCCSLVIVVRCSVVSVFCLVLRYVVGIVCLPLLFGCCLYICYCCWRPSCLLFVVRLFVTLMFLFVVLHSVTVLRFVGCVVPLLLRDRCTRCWSFVLHVVVYWLRYYLYLLSFVVYGCSLLLLPFCCCIRTFVCLFTALLQLRLFTFGTLVGVLFVTFVVLLIRCLPLFFVTFGTCRKTPVRAENVVVALWLRCSLLPLLGDVTVVW